MLWFRSFALGLLGACCVLLATRPKTTLVLANPPPYVMVPAECPAATTNPGASVTVIDVAPSVPGTLIAQLVVLAANEHITAIDDAPVLDGRAALTGLDLRGRRYVDIAITSDAGVARRVLVLAAR